jgi:hypothetical protein
MHRPPPIEQLEDQAEDALGLLAGVERDLAGRRLDVTGGDGDDQLPAAGLVELALVHPLLEDGEFRLVHHPGQPEQEAIEVLGRVVYPVGVGQQDAEPGIELDEVMPILARAGRRLTSRPRIRPTRSRAISARSR